MRRVLSEAQRRALLDELARKGCVVISPFLPTGRLPVSCNGDIVGDIDEETGQFVPKRNMDASCLERGRRIEESCFVSGAARGGGRGGHPAGHVAHAWRGGLYGLPVFYDFPVYVDEDLAPPDDVFVGGGRYGLGMRPALVEWLAARGDVVSGADMVQGSCLPYGELYSATAPGFSVGMFQGAAMQFDEPFAKAFGLPIDPEAVAHPDTAIPDDNVTISWIIDNGAYELTGFPGARDDTRSANEKAAEGVLQAPLVGPAVLDPRQPLSNPRMFYGLPGKKDGGNPIGQMAREIGPALAIAMKAVATVMGAAATTVAVLNVIAGAGLGAISSLAGTLATGLGVATSAVSQMVAAAMPAVAATANASGLSIGALPGQAAALALKGAETAIVVDTGLTIGAAGITAVGVTAVIMTVVEMLLAFPASSPSQHIVTMRGPIFVWYLDESGNLTFSVVADPIGNVPGSPGFGHGDTAADIAAFMKSNPRKTFDGSDVAQVSDITADTFFAGLHYLRAFPIRNQSSGNRLDLLWVPRTSGPGLAAFKQARAQGQTISQSLHATIAAQGQPPPTPSERQLLNFLPPAAQAMIKPSLNTAAIACLADAHATNEGRATAYASSPALAAFALSLGGAHGTAPTQEALRSAVLEGSGLGVSAPDSRGSSSSVVNHASRGSSSSVGLTHSNPKAPGPALAATVKKLLATSDVSVKSASSSSSSSGGGAVVLLLGVAGAAFALSKMRA